MNRLSTADRVAIIRCLCEGNSIRSTCRITGKAKNTVIKLLVDMGATCSEFQDTTLRGLSCKRLQLDEIWSFVGTKNANIPAERKGESGIGDVWTWTAVCADTKLVPSFLVADRSADSAMLFVEDLRARVLGRVQVTTDGNGAYLAAVDQAFGADVDYAMLIKTYGAPNDSSSPERKYSPSKVNGSETRVIHGKPDQAHIATSYVERQNLTMRMSMRRFTRLTNGFSKKLENLAAAVSLYFAYYNFARPHMTLTKAAGGKPTTPAMAAGKADHAWTIDEFVGLLDVRLAAAAPPKPRVPWARKDGPATSEKL